MEFLVDVRIRQAAKCNGWEVSFLLVDDSGLCVSGLVYVFDDTVNQLVDEDSQEHRKHQSKQGGLQVAHASVPV